MKKLFPLSSRRFSNFFSPVNQVVFIRHGESEYNLMNRFTGWQDVKLTQKGIQEAQNAGKILKANQISFDVCYTSMLKRSIWTYYQIADELNIHWIPHLKDWRLNEKHYGALQGLQKDQDYKNLSASQMMKWRSGYDEAGLSLKFDDFRHPMYDVKYKDVPPNTLPGSESMKDTEERVVPFWEYQICKDVQDGKRVLIVSHKNTLRAIFSHLLHEPNMKGIQVPNALPIIFDFNQEMQYLRHYTLTGQNILNDKQTDMELAALASQNLEGSIDKIQQGN